MYAEYIFLTNWAVNSAAVTLSLSLFRRETDTAKILTGAAFIAADAFIRFDGVAAGVLRLAFALLGLRFVTIEEPPAVSLGIFFTFVLLSAAINGAASALSVKYPYFNEAVFSASLATALIVVTAISELFSAFINDRKKVSARLYEVRVAFNGVETAAQGFYDSGNTMTENGIPVIILSERFALKNKIIGQKSLFVSTVAGVKRLRASPLKIDVYFDSGKHKVYETFGAIAETNVKADVILHSSMMED